jgi:hypothetical protein
MIDTESQKSHLHYVIVNEGYKPCLTFTSNVAIT